MVSTCFNIILFWVSDTRGTHGFVVGFVLWDVFINMTR